MSEFDPTLVESLLETRLRLQRLLSYAESGMKSSAVSLIKKQLLNSQYGVTGFFVGVMNSVTDTALRANLQDCLWALLSMRGSPAPPLFGESGLYPNLPEHEQWNKSIAVLKRTVERLSGLQSGIERLPAETTALTSATTVPLKADAVTPVCVDAHMLLRDAEEVLRFLQRLPSETTTELKHWPTSFLFQSFFHFVERLATHLRPISDNCPAKERGQVILEGISEGDRAEFVTWSKSLESLLREICLERFGARFFFATRADSGERLIYFESRKLTAFSPSQAGLPDPEAASLAKLQAADIHGLDQFISRLAELVGRSSAANMKPTAETCLFVDSALPHEWCEVVLWLKDRYCANEPGSLRMFRESEAAAVFPTLLNLDVLWSLLEAEGAIGDKRTGHFAIDLPDTDTATNHVIFPLAEDLRDIKPGIWSFAKAAVRPERTILPATKEHAAWSVSRMLAEILGWATYPDPNTLSLAWWEKHKANAESVLTSAAHSFGDDENTLKKLGESRGLIVRFLGLLYHNPKLATVSVHEWPVKAYQRLFDDLSELEREFRNRGNAQPGSQKPKAATQNSGSTNVAPEAITLAITPVEPDADESRIAPEFTGLWKHLYEFLWQLEFDLSDSQDDFKVAFEAYRTKFGKKTIGSGKRKRPAYKMPTSSGAKSIRQGYHRQLNRHPSRK